VLKLQNSLEPWVKDGWIKLVAGVRAGANQGEMTAVICTDSVQRQQLNEA